MQVGVKQQIAGMPGHNTECKHASAIVKPAVDADHAAAAASLPAIPVSFFLLSGHHSQMRGWAWKAPEFINSGPPALLNNPCCSWRITVGPFLKHAMEVHYG